MAMTAGARVENTALKVRNSWWWGYGMPRPLCWIWHKTDWMLTGNAGYSRNVGGAANVTGFGLMIFGPIEGNLNLIRQYPRLI